MKQVQENLYAFKDKKFFNSLFEEDQLSPADKKKLKDELQKQGMAVVKKCINNFASFKKNAGDIWQEYRDFWSTQEDAEESVQQKGMFYNMWESDYIVGVVKEPQGHAAIKVINTSGNDDEYIAFACTNPDVVKAFQEFYANDLKATIKQVIDNQKASMKAKKAADAQREKDESAAKKKSQLDAFLGESKKEEGKFDVIDEDGKIIDKDLPKKIALKLAAKKKGWKTKASLKESFGNPPFSKIVASVMRELPSPIADDIEATLDGDYGMEMKTSLEQIKSKPEFYQWLDTNFES